MHFHIVVSDFERWKVSIRILNHFLLFLFVHVSYIFSKNYKFESYFLSWNKILWRLWFNLWWRSNDNFRKIAESIFRLRSDTRRPKSHSGRNSCVIHLHSLWFMFPVNLALMREQTPFYLSLKTSQLLYSSKISSSTKRFRCS